MEIENTLTLKYAEANVNKIIELIKCNGIVVIKDALKKDQCEFIKNELEKTLEKRINSGHYCGNETNQVLDNYFLDNKNLITLIYQDITDQLMRKLIDNDYVLISPSARNRRILKRKNFGEKTSGMGWHTDARYIGGKGISPSLCYMSILCIDSFTKENGCTHYIPKSHLLYDRPKNREENLSHNFLVAEKGDLVFLDTALWHRVGVASEISRWGVFNTYGPWFMKPYHRFIDMFNNNDIEEFNPIIRQLLHYDSNPPRDHNESMITLRRVRDSSK